MRDVTYKTYWSYLGGGVKRQASLAEFLLDIPYLMAKGIIPPLHVLNEVLEGGGNNGGMGPGTTWRRFKIKADEYEELVGTLLAMDVEKAKETHPYVRFEVIQVDTVLDKCASYYEWLGAISAKYTDSG